TEIGFLGDVLFATSNSGAAGRPWLFNLAGRGPFLNPYICQFYGAVQHAGPFVFGEGADASNTCVDGNLVYVCQDAPGRIITVSPTSWSVLAGGLSRPGGIAVYPPPTPPITSGAVVLRIDAGDDSGEGTNANVLLVDDLGRRLGRLPNGDAVNDFGAGAVALDLGPGGAVRVYAIVDPAPGTFDVQVAGTQAGPYALRGYLADTALGGAAVSVSGQAQPGVIEARTLRLTGPLDLAFGVPCPADFNDDGALTTSDISAFLVAWFSDLAGGTAAADFNADGSVTTSDISAFLAAWFQGLTDC
ncbi:MAG TPA: GC-type dockerin domain-anchored protein, partial [Phycisphaerales bacterium]|nr:GC-type dockerin domain-anchored protein [Phycisphaerales bacterium]